MTVTTTIEDGKLTLEVEGRLDTTTAPELEKVLKDNLGELKELELNLEKTVYVSSAGLRVLLNSQKIMTEREGSLLVTNVSEDVMDVLQITGFTDIINIQ